VVRDSLQSRVKFHQNAQFVRLSVCNDVTVPLCKTARKPRAKQQGCFCFVIITARECRFTFCMLIASAAAISPLTFFLFSLDSMCVDVDIGTDMAALNNAQSVRALKW
jgi:hypothetical protein